MPTCFVIMPLTTPQQVVSGYLGDPDHFIHVLEHLFRPAVEGAGYELVKPIMKGADLIHAEIIKNLEEADLVLCDVSLLNANVFFELGIRTALDRPVALVKDDLTSSYPFDTSMINYHSYSSSLAPWTLEGEVSALIQHLHDSADRAEGRNSLWRYFGLTQRATPAEIQNPLEEKIDLLVREVEQLKSQERPPVAVRLSRSNGLLDAESIDRLPKAAPDSIKRILMRAVKVADKYSARFTLVDFDSANLILDLGAYWMPEQDIAELVAYGIRLDVEVHIMRQPG